MQVSASILQMLEQQKIHFDVTEVDSRTAGLTLVGGASAPCVVKALLVRDAKGQAQVLLPAGHILDLDAMFRHFGRHFEGVSAAEIHPMIAALELNHLPAIPRWQGMATFIDASLLKKDRLLLESGNTGQMLALSQADFTAICATSTIDSFAIPAPALPTDTDQDESQIIRSMQRFTERRIRQRLDETLELPPLPETAQRIIRLRADPEADISDLANIVEIDPSLAAQVVSWAASPYYSAPGKIKSVHDAIVRVLGFDMVLNLALGLALGKTLSMKALNRAQVESYWRNAVYTAAAVEGLVTNIPREHRPGFGMAYLSGLLNNFGHLVMAEIFPPYFDKLTHLAAGNPHLPQAVIEQHLMGVTGNQIGAWLLDNWNMPEEVVSALRHQYNPGYRGEHCIYARLVYLARQLLANQGFGGSLGDAIPPELFTQVHLDAAVATQTIRNILDSGEDLDAIANSLRG